MGMVNGVNGELKIADEHASFIFNCYTFNKSTRHHIIPGNLQTDHCSGSDLHDRRQ